MEGVFVAKQRNRVVRHMKPFDLGLPRGARNKRILATPIGSNGATLLHLFSMQERARALRIAADIFHDKNVITRPHGRCNDGPSAAELK
jgi:hypothetical protein